MTRILKFPLDFLRTGIDRIEVVMPPDSKVIHCALQHGIPTVWVEAYYPESFQPTFKKTTRSFLLKMTGEEVETGQWEHVGTFLADDDAFVGHVYVEAPVV